MKLLRYILSHIILITFLFAVVAIFYYRTLLFPYPVVEKVDGLIAKVYPGAIEFSSKKDYFWVKSDKTDSTDPSSTAPTDVATTTPPVVTTEPESTTAVKPGPVVTTEPESTTAVKPGPVVTTEPESTTAVKPGPVVTAEPESTTAVKPEPVVTAEPESTTAVKPEPVVTAEPESTTAVKPGPMVTAEPESTTAVKPEPVVTAEPESPTPPVKSATSNSQSAALLLFQARTAFAEGKPKESEQFYRDLIELDKNNPDPYGELGNIYYSQGLWTKSGEAYFQAAVKLISQNKTDQVYYLHKVLMGLDSKKAAELAKLMHSKKLYQK